MPQQTPSEKSRSERGAERAFDPIAVLDCEKRRGTTPTRKVRALLKLTETPPHDAADALAVAITHLESTDPASPWQRERVVV